MQSDYPYAPAPAYPAFLDELESYGMSSELRSKINHRNAEAIMPNLSTKNARV